MQDIYLYGMILVTNSFLLQDVYPQPDTYGEIQEKYSLPGGETGTCATVLANLGVQVKMDGNHMGKNTYPMIEAFYKDKCVDITSLYYDKAYEGLEDYVLIDKNTRTPFGSFQHYYGDAIKRWNKPKREDVKHAQVVGLDPFFGDETLAVASICHEMNKPYVTIDCPYDESVHQWSTINVLSNEFIGMHYKDCNREELFKTYTERSNGLVIFTLGANQIMYGRKGEAPKYFTPYKVEVVSTLGAGDTFKAGCIYGLLKKMSDLEIVQFASALAGVAISRFPLPLNPPTVEEVQALIKAHNEA